MSKHMYQSAGNPPFQIQLGWYGTYILPHIHVAPLFPEFCGITAMEFGILCGSLCVKKGHHQ